jgi:prophage DNA circulation protein
MTFEVSNTDGRPTPQRTSLAIIEQTTKDVIVVSQIDVAENFGVTVANASGNFEDAMSKVSGAIDAINSATEPFAVRAREIDEFTELISDTSAEVTTLVDNPLQLADSNTNLFLSVNGLYATVIATFDVLVSLFGFGDDDIDLVFPNTAQSIERQNNRDVLNNNMRTMALTFAYLNASQIEFTTTDELSEVENQLEVQYQKLFVSDTLPAEVLEALTTQRSRVQEFFDEEEPNLRSTITVRTNPISARRLSFKYYGDSGLGQDIVDLNNAPEPVFLEGDVDIFSLTST